MTDQVRTAHLLIKHKDSRNPISRRTNQGIKISKEEALEEIQKFQELFQREGMQSFPQKAFDRSDCSSHRAGGDLGFFSRGMMQRAFEDVSFQLNVGEMSDIVETDSGYHLIYRIE